jgi:transposase
MVDMATELTDAQWKTLEPLLPKPEYRWDRRGRPWTSNRQCLEGILWMARSGARWKDLPRQYGSPATVWRRLRKWEEDGTLLRAWQRLLGMLEEGQRLEWEETFIDGSFAPAKRGASASEKPSGAREQSGWFWSMAKAFLWEPTLIRPRLPRSSSSRRRSTPS